ncbi:hypothetical protein BB561_002579 [Smittium simulii]|uniref:Uncharacterized protein n=1 Tax=Smittium simulii TaxID=133385 RepID=A0A2T9YPX7_9FUNG|nr:hypothetical protein BB561_002579 [Smittium simulii]
MLFFLLRKNPKLYNANTLLIKNYSRSFVNSSKNSVQGNLKQIDNFTSREADITYIQEIVKKEAYETYLTSLFSNKGSREAFWAISAFNLELSKSSTNPLRPEIALLKLNWWSNNINDIYKGTYLKSPVARALYESINKYKISKMWFTRNIRARIAYVKGEKFNDIKDVEKYGENTIASTLHAQLETLGVRNINADNGARLIGQATSIAYLIQNILYMASLNKIEIPLDLVQKVKLTIINRSSPKDLENAIYDLSCVGFTRLCGASEIYIPNSPKEAIPSLLFGIPIISWYERLEKSNFNIYDPKLHRRPFTLPFRIWKAFNKKSFI